MGEVSVDSEMGYMLNSYNIFIILTSTTAKRQNFLS